MGRNGRANAVQRALQELSTAPQSRPKHACHARVLAAHGERNSTRARVAARQPRCIRTALPAVWRACSHLPCRVRTNISPICASRTAGTVALKIAYGYQNENNEFKQIVKDTEDALRMFAIAALPGVFLVDTLPFCAFSVSRTSLRGLLLTRQQYASFRLGSLVLDLGSWACARRSSSRP